MYRRDLPAVQACELADLMGLRKDDLLVDLGCGTGQLSVPLMAYCKGAIVVDPEPHMLAGLRARQQYSVMCLLGDDSDVPTLAPFLSGPVGAVVVGNALHWMDAPVALRSCADLLRPGGAIAVLTQGPPLWLGDTAWQVRVRRVLEERLGPVTANCGAMRRR